MGAITEVTILYRHPDARVRKLQPKVLEFKNEKGESDYFMPETVPSTRGDQVVYKVPLAFARRLLADQPERYHLLQPAELTVKRKLPGGLSSEFVKVTNKLASDFLTKENPDAVAQKAAADEQARLDKQRQTRDAADQKARDEVAAKDQADKEAKEKEDQEKLDREAAARKEADEAAAQRALETADIGTEEAPAGTPPVEL